MPRRRLRSTLPAALLTATFAAGCSPPVEPNGTNDPTPTPTATEPPAPCAPTASGTLAVLEGETAFFTVTCATGRTLDGLTPEISPFPPGATFDPVAGRFSWTTGLADAATWHVRIHLPETAEDGEVTVAVTDHWEHPENVPLVDPIRYEQEFGLPVIHLSPAPEDDDLYAPTTILYRGHVYEALAKKRGWTSIHYPKNSYTLKFPKEDEFGDPDLGFVGRRKVALTTTFDDNSYLRNRLAYTLWNRLDPLHLPIGAYHAVVYLDGRYWGLYTVSDHVDRFHLEQSGLAEGLELFKATHHQANFDLVYQGEPKTSPHQGLQKKEGVPPEGEPGAFASIDELVRFVATSDDAVFAAEIGERTRLADYEDWWVFVTFLLAHDSAGKNSFHARAPGDQWRFVPWDFNGSFGQAWNTSRQRPDDAQTFAHKNRLFARLLAVPALRDRLHARVREALDGPFALETVLADVDRIASEIEPSARRDERRWGETYRTYAGWRWRTDFTTWDQEVAYVRQWLRQRVSYQDARY